jgi:outer membrane lipoprotein-sorting protein
VAVVAAGTALALAAGSAPKPPAKALAPAVRDAIVAPEPAGVTARIKFTNRLLGSSSPEGAGPVLSGATGRLWATPDGRFRLELQSDRGDAQIVSDGSAVWAFDASSNTVYRFRLPAERTSAHKDKADQPPSLARIQHALTRLGRSALLAGPTPANVAGRPAYSVRITPKDRAGLLDGAGVAWDATHGVPLRAALYARGQSSPVLALEATDIDFGPVKAHAFELTPPAGAKTVDLTPARERDKHGHLKRAEVTGVAAVQKALGFKLSAPARLAGRARDEVHLLGEGERATAVVTYGRGLGALAVLQQARHGKAGSAAHGDGPLGHMELPTVSINGTKAQELQTPLGTVLRFERGNVTYTVLGSVVPAAARAAARGL